MAGYIFGIAIGVGVLAIGAWCVWFENHGSDTDSTTTDDKQDNK